MQPNFLILGARKAGTTSLHHYLRQHPDVSMSEPKEPRFFSRQEFFDKGLDFYWQQYFRPWRGETAVGEADPDNLFLPFVANRIGKLLPDAKLVVVARNPADRAYSHWWMDYSYGLEALPFEDALRDNWRELDSGFSLEGDNGSVLYSELLRSRRNGHVRYRSYLEEGFYAEQVERYLQWFDASRVHVILFEDLERDTSSVVRELCRFLGVDPSPPVSETNARNVAFGSRAVGSLVARTQRMVASTGVTDLLPARWRSEYWPKLVSPLARIGRRPSMPPDTRADLVAHYRKHNERLERLLDRDLSAWNRL